MNQTVAREIGPSPHIVKIDRLSVIYEGTHNPSQIALQDVCLKIERGTWISVIGANGSGKSTLAKVVTGLCLPTKGHIEVDAKEHVYIVLQHPETQILGDTVYEELDLIMKHPEADNGRERISSILQDIGLDLPLDSPTDSLSGGEKQLLNIAVSVAAGTTLIVLDEATSMLDPASRDQVIHAMQKLHGQGATILWITHRSEELAYADRVLFLEKGRISFDGTSRRFFYGDPGESVVPCVRYGMTPPYVVQVVQQLGKRGYSLPDQPLLPHDLAEAIRQSCLST